MCGLMVRAGWKRTKSLYGIRVSHSVTFLDEVDEYIPICRMLRDGYEMDTYRFYHNPRNDFENLLITLKRFILRIDSKSYRTINNEQGRNADFKISFLSLQIVNNREIIRSTSF